MDNFEHALEKANEALRQEKQCLEVALEYWKAKTASVEAESEHRLQWAKMATMERNGAMAEVEHLRAGVERLTRERDELVSLCAQLERSTMALTHERAEAIHERDEWKARAEAAEADLRKTREVLGETELARRMAEGDNAALLEVFGEVSTTLEDKSARFEVMSRMSFDAQRDLMSRAHRAALAAYKSDHPGAALLERLRAAEKVVELGKAYLAYVYDDAELDKALATYDATKEGAGEARLVTTTPAHQGTITLVPEEP